MAAAQAATLHLKLRQIAASRDIVTMDSYRKSPSPYPTVLSPTPYNVSFSHNACVTDRQTDRQTDRDTSYPSLDLTVGQNLALLFFE